MFVLDRPHPGRDVPVVWAGTGFAFSEFQTGIVAQVVLPGEGAASETTHYKLSARVLALLTYFGDECTGLRRISEFESSA